MNLVFHFIMDDRTVFKTTNGFVNGIYKAMSGM